MRYVTVVLAAVLFSGCASQRAETLNATGIEKLNVNDNVAAAAAFGSAVKLNPNVAKYHYNLGLSYARLHYADEAATQFQEALKIEPGDADASRMLTLANASIAMRQRGY